VIHFKYDLNINQNITYNSDLYFHEAVTLSNVRVLIDEKKFLYLFQCEEYDIVEIIVRGVNEMYNRRNELIDK
jgi:hypothetical protein